MHDIRHSYATAALAAGVPPKVISQRLGHDRDHDGHLPPGHPEPGRAGRRDGARLILGDGEVIADLSANKPLATGPGTD